MSLGSAGEKGSNITGDVSKYLIQGYLPTIGIECHVQLATKTKLFSAVDNDAREAEPNSKVSAIDYALPGMLPYLNREAVRLAARAALALNAEVARVSRFDRKHYFYPDLPKGYQISQMYQPTILSGHVDLPDGTTVRINHAHLEEDAGKLTHHGDHSEVDLNRAGTPLIEIVSEPDMHSAAQAKLFAQELWLLMTYAGVTHGDLYHGNMRFDVNVSVSKTDQLGTRSEVKNLNSFKSVERAVEYEIKRQIELLEKGQSIVQETRGWDDAKAKTTSQRSKENAQDYRYMPDPDIPPIILSEPEIKQMQADLPLLPTQYRAEFAALEVDSSVIGAVLSNPAAAQKLHQVLETSTPDIARRIANWFASAIPVDDENLSKFDLPSAANLIKLSDMTAAAQLSSTAAKEVFAAMLKHDTDPAQIAENKNLLQVSDSGEIAKIVAEVLAAPASQKAVADIKSGNDKAIGYLVGQVMKASKGQANPTLAQKLIRSKIG
ncbi:MAG: Asp-tRNA(Asn)/Glu-tRNA(Gln) amidotransferase subunit GatB [Candidatus Nomurabacteria bacterium]|jgi:aspartyl-tRNA(Asn)/glutamyl-tRNA(Gln) amidotransferase subunit B|nr:Asp-tRNA(Asn)/Glu-tRNA(Gln) amidotransferase subunit GatB [Candidatus Nomurabacteria bacterium]